MVHLPRNHLTNKELEGSWQIPYPFGYSKAYHCCSLAWSREGGEGSRGMDKGLEDPGKKTRLSEDFGIRGRRDHRNGE